MLSRSFLILSIVLLTLLPSTLTIQCSGNTVLRNYQCIACPTGTISQQNQCILLSSSYYGSNISPYPYIVQVCASDEIFINGRCFKKSNVNAWMILLCFIVYAITVFCRILFCCWGCWGEIFIELGKSNCCDVMWCWWWQFEYRICGLFYVLGYGERVGLVQIRSR